MIDPHEVLPIDLDETITRFATQSAQFRADKSVKGDLFIPNSKGETSVMRLRDTTQEEVWQIGLLVAGHMGRTLYGRSNLFVADCTAHALRVDPTPILPENPNHADIIQWPKAKEDRKAIALKLAATASKLIERN